MKNLICFLLLVPFSLLSQNTVEYLVFENAMIIPNPAKISQLETGLKAHNDKYHSNGYYGARVYWINNGPNTGNYMLLMGPLPWSAMDGREEMEGHTDDWNTNVAPYTQMGGDQTYWKFNAELSHFPEDFTVNKLLIDTYNIKRGKWEDALKLIKKIRKVYVDKLPDQIYGIYTNEFSSTTDGRDLAVTSFFDKSAWLGQDREFAKKFDEVHGTDSFTQFLKDWMDLTEGGQKELWTYLPKLSGISGAVKVADRQ